jgi:hypothetical protein
MLVEHISPAAVTELVGQLRGPDDVGEEHRGQAAVGIRCPLRAGQEFLDHVEQGVGVANVRQFVATGKLGAPRIGDQLRHRPPWLRAEQHVAGAVQDQRPGLDRRENRPQIELHGPAERRSRRARGRRHSLPPPVPGKEPGVIGA